MNYADLAETPYAAPSTRRNPTSGNGIALLSALQRGLRLTPLTSPAACGVVALSQEVGRLKELGWPVKSQMITLTSGKRVSEYWL